MPLPLPSINKLLPRETTCSPVHAAAVSTPHLCLQPKLGQVQLACLQCCSKRCQLLVELGAVGQGLQQTGQSHKHTPTSALSVRRRTPNDVKACHLYGQCSAPTSCSVMTVPVCSMNTSGMFWRWCPAVNRPAVLPLTAAPQAGNWTGDPAPAGTSGVRGSGTLHDPRSQCLTKHKR